MPLAQAPSQYDDIERRGGPVDIVGDAEIVGHDGDARMVGERPHEFECGGSRVHEHRVSILHERGRGSRDGAFCLGIHVNALVLDRYGERLGQRDGSSVRAPELAIAGERIKIRSGGDARDAEALGKLEDLHRGGAVKQGEYLGATLLGGTYGRLFCGVQHGGSQLCDATRASRGPALAVPHRCRQR